MKIAVRILGLVFAGRTRLIEAATADAIARVAANPPPSRNLAALTSPPLPPIDGSVIQRPTG